MSPATRSAAVLATGALLVLPFAGCGDDNSDDSSSSTDEATSAATTEDTTAAGGGGAAQSVDVSETDFALNPSNPTVKAGEVTFKATNDGETTHSLEIEGPGEESELPTDLAPGDSGEVTVDLSEPGTYEWYCPIGNHKDLGMKGTITVK